MIRVGEGNTNHEISGLGCVFKLRSAAVLGRSNTLTTDTSR